MSKSHQLDRIRESVIAFTVSRVECFVCGAEEDGEDVGETAYAEHLYESGWRYEISEQYGAEGVMCPTCVGTPDEDR